MSREALHAALPDLVAKGLITAEQAERIRAEYTGSGVPEDRKGQRMTAVLGTVGAALIGLGLVLLVAHNWDGLPRGVRALLAVLPVLAGQAIVAFGLWRRPGRTAWTEGGSVFLAAAVGACLAIIAQLFHLGGALHDFVLLWSVLILGLCYVPGSAVVGLGVLGLITWQAVLVRMEDDTLPWAWALLLMAFLPAAVRRIRDAERRVAAGWTGAMLAIAIAVGVHLFIPEWHPVVVVGTAALASLFTLTPWWSTTPAPGTTAMRRVGDVLLLWLLLMLGSFTVVDAVQDADDRPGAAAVVVAVLVLAAGGAYARAWRRRRPLQGGPLPEGFVAIGLLYLVSLASPFDLPNQAQLVVRVNPVHYPLVLEAKNDLQRMVGGQQTITILSDQSLGEADCLVETGNGAVDARMETQLGALRQRLEELVSR